MSILFHHLPKSGGTYVIRCLEAAGLSHCRIPYGAAPHLGPHRDVYSSHWLFDPNENPPTPSTIRITWLRDPVAMAVSAFHYFRRISPTVYAKAPLRLRAQIRTMRRAADLLDYARTVADPYPSHHFPRDLRAFHFVGLAEDMPGSLASLSRLLGHDIYPLEEPINVGNYPTTDHKARQLLTAKLLNGRCDDA